MPEHEIARIVRYLKEPVDIDPALDARVMAAVEAFPRHGVAPRARRLWAWLRRGRAVSVSPLGGLAAAAAMALLVLVASGRVSQQGSTPAATGTDTTVVQFVLLAPEAASVSLVGDFNDWDLTATPLRGPRHDGVWTIAIPLEPGRYRYSFLVDGVHWVRDPSAPPALEDDFGRPNSVVTVGG